MLNQIETMKSRAREELDKADNPAALESWRVRYLGKKSELTQILRGLDEVYFDVKMVVLC